MRKYDGFVKNIMNPVGDLHHRALYVASIKPGACEFSHILRESQVNGDQPQIDEETQYII